MGEPNEAFITHLTLDRLGARSKGFARTAPHPIALAPRRTGEGEGRPAMNGSLSFIPETAPSTCNLGGSTEIATPPAGARKDVLAEAEGRPPVGDSPSFVPEITAFTCNYCAYMAADTAGALRETYPSNVKLVRLPCTGKTDVQYLLDAFEQGADAVFVVACSLGNCHHVRGNERGRARVARAKKLLTSIGLDPERLEMYFVSGGMGATFARIAQGMTARALVLGPNPLKPGPSPSPHASPPPDGGERAG